MKPFTQKIDLKFVLSIIIFCLFIMASHEIIQLISFDAIPVGRLKRSEADNEKVSVPKATLIKPAFAYYDYNLNYFDSYPFFVGLGLVPVPTTIWNERTLKEQDFPPINEYPQTYAAIVVDDLGINYRLAKEFMEIGLDFTFAVLPDKTYTAKIAKNASGRGFEIMLHLPMEPYETTGKDPGEDALLTSMSDDEIRNKINDMLKSIPVNILGVNNHMGSKFCENYNKMSSVMSILKEHGLYFLDSKTSENSCGKETARKYEVPNAARELFLDNSKEEADILKQVDQLVSLSKKHGYAIAICHPYPETIAALGKVRGILEKNNVKIKKLSAVLAIVPEIKKKKEELLIVEKK